MKIAIMGSGGLGGLFGGLLAAAGSDVTFVARGAHLEAMQKTGLSIRSKIRSFTLEKVNAVASLVDVSPVDCVIFAVKGQDTRSASEVVAPVIGAKTAIVSFQNGVEWLNILSERFTQDAIIPCAVMTAARIAEPGVIEHVGQSMPLTIGELSGKRSARLVALVELLRDAGANVAVTEDIRTEIWSKFVMMATMSALTCLTRLPVRSVVTALSTRELAIASMKEIIALAKARNIDIPEGTVESVLEVTSNIDPSWKTSMCNDLESGKPIEIDSISGAIHRIGQDLGIPTPFHTMAHKVLLPFSEQSG